LAGLGAMIVLPGCAAGPQQGIVGADNQKNLLFAPGSAGVVTYDTPRSDWPSTTAFDNSSEQITFSEYISDVQGLSDSSQDYTYRRFSSTRKGTRRR